MEWYLEIAACIFVMTVCLVMIPRVADKKEEKKPLLFIPPASGSRII